MYSELLWSVFSSIRTAYGDYRDILRISPYSVWMWENADQNNSEYGRFSRSDSFLKTKAMTFSCYERSLWVSSNFVPRAILKMAKGYALIAKRCARGPAWSIIFFIKIIFRIVKRNSVSVKTGSNLLYQNMLFIIMS